MNLEIAEVGDEDGRADVSSLFDARLDGFMWMLFIGFCSNSIC